MKGGIRQYWQWQWQWRRQWIECMHVTARVQDYENTVYFAGSQPCINSK